MNGHPGIYFRRGSDGRRVYEITYRDSDGRQRWHTVHGGLVEAEAARDRVRGRMRRGERVAPNKVTLAELAAEWLAQVSGLRPSSLAWYASALRLHVIPRIGQLKVSEITTDTASELVADLQRGGLAATTIINVLVPLNRVLDHGVRRGLLPANPVKGLERHERPRIQRNEMRILDGAEIDRLLTHAPERYRTLLAAAVFTGLRSGEILGLHWTDVDFTAGVIRVHHQVSREGVISPLKTRNARREVLLMPTLARMLREHRLASPHSQPGDYVFARPDGRPMHPDTVRKLGLHKAVQAARLDQPGKPRLRFHDLRHTYASLLIAQGVNVAFASRQLGHASVSTTLNVYTHLFDHAEHAATVLERLEGRFGTVLQPTEAPSQAICETVAMQRLGSRAVTTGWPDSERQNVMTQRTTATTFFNETTA